MPTIEFSCEISADIERVWAWHDDVQTALPALSPPGDDVKLERADVPIQVGSEVVILAKGPFGRLRWVARYVEYVPPHPVVYGIEARFVDEQVSGPFAFWRHSHEFEALDAKRTRLVDRIDYRPPLWPLSFPADVVLIRPKLRAMFAHRHRALQAAFPA